ncbi:MAG: HD domain-containing phosphohydrolase [Dehalococcoidales bacterium]
MNSHLLVPLIGVVSGLTLLTVLAVSGRKHAAKRPFVIFLFFMTLWAALIFMMRASLDMEMALVWERFALWAILSASLLFFRFTVVYTQARLNKYFTYSLYAAYFLVLGLIPTGLIAGGMQSAWYGKTPEVGVLFPLFVLCTNLFIAISAVLLKKHYKSTRAIDDRVRDQYLITGITLMIIGMTTDFLPAMGVKVFPAGIIGNILFCVIATAAMLRYNLLDMKVVARKGATFSLAVLLLFAVFGSIIYLLSYFSRDLLSPVSVTLTIIIVSIAALLFQPVVTRLRLTVDRWFYRERYDHLQNLKRFTWANKSDLDLEQLTASLVDTVSNGMQSRAVYLLLPVPASGNYITYNHAGLKNRKEIHFSANSPFITAMTQLNRVVDFIDLDTIPSLAEMPARDRQALNDNDIELMVPLRNNGHMAGMLLLDSKISREPYSYEERRLLQEISGDLATNIENANSFETMKRKHSELQKAISGVVHAVSILVGSRDPYTAGHQRRVAELAREIAREMGLSEWQTTGVFISGLLHDVGKVSVPAEILSKSGQITASEFAIIKNHCRVGYDILKKIDFPWPVTRAILQHHERLNGSGYPEGLKENQIIMEARILGVADVVEAMASQRPYRPALGLVYALAEIKRGRGVIYDADIVDVCLKLLNQNEPEFDRIMAAAEADLGTVIDVTV